MIRQYLGAICMVGAISGVAGAKDLKEEQLTVVQPAIETIAGTSQSASCSDPAFCQPSPEDAKARVAMALLFLGISNNCGQRPCAVRLAASH